MTSSFEEKEVIRLPLLDTNGHLLSSSSPNFILIRPSLTDGHLKESTYHSGDDAHSLDKEKRRYSLGDSPHNFHEAMSAQDDIDFLIGRASGHLNPRIRMTEVVPLHASLLEDSRRKGWRMPIEIFSGFKKTYEKKMPKRIRSYYKAQNELIEAFEHIDQSVRYESSVIEPNQGNAERVELYSKLALLVNILLLVAKAIASSLSGSMSIISSLVDSCLDLLSGSIMWWATRAMKNRDIYHYPQGRTKLEPVAVIILSVVMALASVQLIQESVQKIIGLAKKETSLPLMGVPTFTIIGSTVVIKFILWLMCRRKRSTAIRALAQDHRNDVLSNLVAIVCGYIGSQNFMDISGTFDCAYVDPLGAILISVYILLNWWQTGSVQIKMLTGHTARPDFLSKLTWVSFNHHKEILEIDTVRAFHFGNNFLVEVDIVLPTDMHLKKAHDIGESLQHRLESLPEVERAFVHLDYESTHNPRSEHKVV